MRIAINEGWVPRRLVSSPEGVLVELVRLPGRRPLRAGLSLDLDACEQKTLVPADDLFSRYRTRTPAPAVGMIFHVSRCGSTLVSQMFQHLHQCKVASEPDALGNLIQYYGGPRDELIRMLRILVDVLDRALCDTEERLIIKWPSWSAACMDIIQEAFPDAPKCFLYRDPVEVLVSMLERPPGWRKASRADDLKGAALTAGAAKEQGGTTEYGSLLRAAGYYNDVPEAERYARSLALMCRAVADAPRALLPVDYRDLPQAVFNEIAPLFGLGLSGKDKERMQQATRLDTKSFEERRPFVPDSEDKQRRATKQVRDLAERYVTPALEAVRARRQEAIEAMAARPAAPGTPDAGSATEADAAAPPSSIGPVVKWLS